MEISREEYRALYESAPVGYFILDPETLILRTNLAGAAQLKVTPPELLRQPFTRYIKRESQDTFYHHRRQLLKSKSRTTCELEMVKGEGEIFFAHLETVLLPAQGQARQILVALIDITQRKRMEQENEQLLEVLQQRNRQVQALSRRLAEAQEAEQRRIAQELHDRVGQGLTAIGFHVEYIKGQIEKFLPEAQDLQGHLGTTLNLVSETTDHVRNMLAEIRPPMLDEYGLLATFEWYAEQFTGWSGVAVQVQGKEPAPRLGEQAENILFRILQEALTNVAKHAQASEVVVSLQPRKDIVYLSITDNGVGLEATRQGHATPSKSWGLHIMAERAEMIGGLCRIESQPGQGTRVIVEAPLEPEGEEREEGLYATSLNRESSG